jgi:hypothetical protein
MYFDATKTCIKLQLGEVKRESPIYLKATILIRARDFVHDAEFKVVLGK